jgi:hypothetical protein
MGTIILKQNSPITTRNGRIRTFLDIHRQGETLHDTFIDCRVQKRNIEKFINGDLGLRDLILVGNDHHIISEFGDSFSKTNVKSGVADIISEAGITNEIVHPTQMIKDNFMYAWKSQ